ETKSKNDGTIVDKKEANTEQDLHSIVVPEMQNSDEETAQQTPVAVKQENENTNHVKVVKHVVSVPVSDEYKLALQKAGALVDQGKLREALNLLERSPPSLTDYPEYYAYLAALYQRNGDSMMSATLYDQLLMVDHKNSAWWVG